MTTTSANRELYFQLVRFGMAGGLSAAIYSLVYLIAARAFVQTWRVLAVFPAFAVATVCGFFLHSMWSFRGHGSRDASGRQHFKFVVVQGVGLLLNCIFTWLVTNLVGGPAWLPLLPCVVLTPMATFALQRQWVFR